MVRNRIDSVDLDQHAYEAADAHFKVVRQALPADAVASVAREVVKRLAFRMPHSLPPDHHPTPEEIERLCAALLSKEELAGDRYILQARGIGVPIEAIYLSYVAGAARRLGEMWEADQVSFVAVTMATGRLYRIIRGLRQVIDISWDESEGKPSLFALVPGDTHTLGINIATNLFRRDGWDVHLSVGEDQEQIIARTESTRFRAIVLVANHETMITTLISLVLSLRITQPMAYVVLAGNIVGRIDNLAELVGADAVMEDLENAVVSLRKIINPDET